MLPNDHAHFGDLVDENPFLFRVYTPKPHSPSITYDERIFCLAPRFNAKYSSPIEDIQHISPLGPIEETTSCLDVIQHMEWTSRSSSPFITTSFSFAWAIWEAMRRYSNGYKLDVEIAVLDARSLMNKAVTASQVMQGTPLDEYASFSSDFREPFSHSSRRPLNFGRWHQFSRESQSVLIYGYIPLTSVMTSIPLRSIIDKMPSYFLQKDSDTIPKAPQRLAWDFSDKKMTFKRFCHEAKKRYLADPPEIRLHETIVDSVRLAEAFLRSWLHETVLVDFELAVERVTQLACSIAMWPDAEDCAGLEGVIRGMVSLLVEQVRAASVSGQVSELAGVIDDLEGVITTLEERLKHSATQHHHSDTEEDDRTAYSPTLATFGPPKRGCDSPLRIAIPSSSSDSDSGSSPVSPMTPDSPTHSLLFRKGSLAEEAGGGTPPHVMRMLASSSSSSHMRRHSLASSTSSTFSRFAAPSISAPVAAVQDCASPAPSPVEPEDGTRKVSMTVSYALTGFLIGSILTLCAASTQQRRTVLLHLS